MNEGAIALLKWRTDEKLTQTQAAQRLGLHTTDISKLENGGGIGLHKAVLLLDAIGIPARAWVTPKPTGGD